MTQKFLFDQFLKWEEDADSAALKDKSSQQTQKLSHRPAAQAPSASLDNIEELRLLGHEIKESLRQMIDAGHYSTYFADTFTVSGLSTSAIEFTITTNFIRNVIESHHLPAIKAAVREILGRDLDISLKTFNPRTASLSSNDENILRSARAQEQKKSSARENTFTIPELTPTVKDQLQTVASRSLETGARPAHGVIDHTKKFANFVVGSSNNMAHASALAVARDPGVTYPNLYIFGGSGLGKTHLIHAIANHIIEHKPHLKVCIVPFNNLMNEYIEATISNTSLNFKKRYTQDVDVLIIDDIHELAGKGTTQEQIFHIFNDLSSRRKQLIFTSDKPPREIAGIDERIRTRLSTCLFAEIHQPDLETRIAILRTKAQEKDFFISDDIVNLIAKCIKSSVRELESSLVQLMGYHNIMKVDIDLQMAKEYLKLDEQIESHKLITPESITKNVAKYFKIPMGDIMGKSKTKDIVLARQVAMYLIHQHLRKTLLEIAMIFGKKDHTTPMYSIEVVKKRLKSDALFAQQLLDIENQL